MITSCILKFKNYKCYSKEYTLLPVTKPINIIIGKNNSGKSALLEIIEYACNTSIKEEMSDIDLLYGIELTEEVLAPHTPQISTDLRQFGKFIYYKLKKGNVTKLHEPDSFSKKESDYLDFYKSAFPNPFTGKVFTKIAAERDLNPEKESPISGHDIDPKGIGFINLLQTLVTSSPYLKELIEEDFRKAINNITEPEIKIDRLDLNKINPPSANKWDIFLKINGETIAISKMGSGIRTILLAIGHFIILPKYRNLPLKDLIFAIEEPENNLHPAVLRRLLLFIQTKIIENNSTVFITTHSNIAIDFFNESTDSQIIHLTQGNGSVDLKSIKELTDKHAILQDLEFKASDLMQSNSIIWVEGPSDRIYINKWISLVDSSLKEGFHYSIMFYGGRLLSHLSCNTNENELASFISLLKINPNIILVIDSDKKNENSKINKTKSRIVTELLMGHSWVTEGREIENYLSKKTVNRWLGKEENEPIALEKFDKCINGFNNYENSKYESSNEIIKHIEEDDLNVFDLKDRVSFICDQIRRWNFIK